ncbi:MAG: YebC/PmpR family DNA-binding transcriptional regulator [Clostridiales bacterium]|jgi:YebC/PmpR family DNA-binding regulatory protein|nr:YebC/PmpR family DNA-binding transcriptional regulator [Clostridiales bacterium]
MSGHSKFANIKHKKERNDAARGRVFTRLGRELAVAVKSGGANPSANERLREAIAKAKANNMPNDTIERSIKKAAGDLNAVNYETVVYEGYGPGGVAVIVDVLTDNRNRAAANVRNAFTKGGGNLGTTGCVSFMFEEKGLIMVEKDVIADEDELTLMALDAGALDVSAQDEGLEIITEPEAFRAVREALEKAGIPMMSAEATRLPQTYSTLSNPEDIKRMRRLLDLLDDEDDVQNVYHNWENES